MSISRCAIDAFHFSAFPKKNQIYIERDMSKQC